jgi:hypothetical protein
MMNSRVNLSASARGERRSAQKRPLFPIISLARVADFYINSLSWPIKPPHQCFLMRHKSALLFGCERCAMMMMIASSALGVNIIIHCFDMQKKLREREIKHKKRRRFH